MNPILLLHLLALQFLFAAAGPPQNKEILRILQLTDFHVDEGYNSNGGVVSAFCHLDNNSPKKSKEEGVEVPSGKFGDHRCDAPQLLLEYVLSEARREVPKPDLIIWTGDNTPHVEFNSTDYAVHSTKWSSEAIRRYFGSEAPVIPTLGNHDFNPANYVPDQPNELYEKTFELWKPWIGEEQRDSFLRGGYYKYSWKGQTFLVLNSNLYYVYNHQKMLDLEDPAGQFEFLRKELELGRKNGVKMNIVGHIPPGAFERELLKLMPAKYNQKLLDLMVEYAPWTNLFIFGHLHTDTFRIVKDAHGNPVQVIFVSAAVSPLHTNNPAFRIYELEVDTLEVHDIKNYFADLEKLNRNGPSLEPMRLEYSYRDAYQMSTLRLEAFAQLLRRLKRDTKTFLKYIHRNSVQSNFTAPSQRERSYQLCAIEFLDHDGYSKCIETFPTVDNGIKKKEGLPENFIVIFAVLSFVFSLNFHVL